MGLLDSQVERCRKEVVFGESNWKKGRRELDVESVESSRRSSRECKVRRRLSRWDGSRSSSSSIPSGESKLSEAGRRAKEESDFSYGNTERGSKLSTVHISEDTLGEVRKFVDDSWRERSNYPKGDVLDSRKVESLKGNGSLGSQRVKRMVEVHWDESKQTSASTHARKNGNRESSTSAAWKSSNRDALTGHTELNRSSEFNLQYNDARCAAYPRRDFNEESSRGREERTYLDQNLSQPRQNEKIHLDKKVHTDKLETKQDELRRSTNKFSETSVSHGIDFERASNIDGKNFTGMDVSSNLVQNSLLVSTDKKVHTGLQAFEENIIKGRKESLSTLDDTVQLRRGEGSWIDSRAVKHNDSGRNPQMHGKVLEAQGDHSEATSHLKEKRVREIGFRTNLVSSPSPVSKDIGTQVDMNGANEELSWLSVNNNIRFNCSRSPPDDRVEPQGYNAPPALKLVSSMTEPLNQEYPRCYLQHGKGMDSERDADVFYYTRDSNRGISSRKETYSSSEENKKGTSLDNESIVLQEWKDKQAKTPLGETSQSTSLQTELTRSSHGTSSLLYSHREVDNQSSRVDIQQIRNSTSLSNRRYNGSSALHASNANTLEEFVVLNESANSPNISSENKIEEPGSRNCQETLRSENQNANSSTMIMQERERQMFKKESSQSKTVKMASSGGASVEWSVQTQIEVDNQLNNDAIESARRFNKSSAMYGDEFVDKVRQEIASMNQSCSTGIQIEEMMQSEGQETTSMQIGDLNESRQYRDERSMKEGRGQCSFGLEMKGPSDEMWDVQGISSQGPSNIKVVEESPAKKAMGFSTTIPTSENSITRKSYKSLWSFVADIIRMGWVRQGQSHSTTDKRPSSNESLSSEAWFSGPEPDEDATGDDTHDIEKIGLLKKSAPLKESDKVAFEESKDKDKLTMGENSPTSSGFLEIGSASALSETENIEQAQANEAILSGVGTVDLQFGKEADSAFHYIPKAERSTEGGKSKVLKPSSSYSVGLMAKGFSSRLTQLLDIEHIEDDQVTGIDVASKLGDDIQKMGIHSFEEKLPEGGGNETEMRQRKLQRNKQVLREQFDEWEEAFKRETDQKNIDEYFMREAILEAKKGADVWEVPVGAVLVQNGKIIARGCNMVEELRDSTAHAEMICIREASALLRTWRLSETTLYVTLEPCPMCAGAILQARIDTVVWGAPNRLLGADGSWVRLFPGGDEGSSSMHLPGQTVGPVHPFHPKIIIRRGILATECGDVMQQFFKLRRKKEKKHETSPPSGLPVSNRPTKFFAKLHHIFGLMFCL
ncbi:hypothetical protein HPP92_002784 [Vanilla planifolia]|uniref:tRNA(adenine(34)) deaminase n=1 Tax=Vanilla planifolia TaxID=51239 RepID=A0A835SF97_VANPL|nr:hypothetical protein HPP92_002784 [Vanilla planifolia]